MSGDGHAHRFSLSQEWGKGSSRTRAFRCGCGLEQRRRYLDGRIWEVRVRLRPLGEWLDPAALLRVVLPFILCPRCGGQEHDVGACGLCRNLGVLQADDAAALEVTPA